MGLRFWRRMKLLPGITLNLSKSGGSLSLGPRGLKLTVGPRGSQATVGIPGTGIFYTQRLSRGGGRARAGVPAAGRAGAAALEDKLTLGFFQRLVTPAEEEALVDGCREVFCGREEEALARLRAAAHLADGAYLAGVLALKKGLWEEAAAWLASAREGQGELGCCFARYGISVSVTVPVTEEVAASIGADQRGVLLGLIEVYQRQGKLADALACAETLFELEPLDPVVRLSLIELLSESRPTDREVCRRIVALTKDAGDGDAIECATLLYKARALRVLGLADAALSTLGPPLRRRRGQPAELRRALRYERALAYEKLGRARQARAELEQLYAEDPDWEDVAQRLSACTGP